MGAIKRIVQEGKSWMMPKRELARTNEWIHFNTGQIT
jgi:hypothetical protein